MNSKAYLLGIRDHGELEDLYIVFSAEDGIIEHGWYSDDPMHAGFIEDRLSNHYDVENIGTMDSREFADRLLARAVEDYE